MRRIMLLLSLIMLMGVQVLFAQRTITGTVTSEDDGEPLPGVTIIIKSDPSVGSVTDFDGKYKINVPEGEVRLVFSFVGMKSKEVVTSKSTTLDVSLSADQFGLDEVIVTGVASGTQKKKLSVSVARVGAEQLEEVPASSAASALQGKVAGVTVTQSAGTPGQAATIIIRGATQMVGSQDPLIIVDGVMVDGTLADINVDDIESYEVVKGASAAALYGSRAGNGVIVISTKSGKNLKKGETTVRIRNEFGISRLANSYDLAEAHQYKLASDWENYKDYTRYEGTDYPADYIGGNRSDISFSRTVDDDDYMDNPYAVINDHQKDMFKGNESYTNYIAVEGNTGKTNFMASFENNKQGGIIDMVDGYKRQNFRLNINHRLTDKLSISASNLYAVSTTKAPGGMSQYNGGVFFALLLMQPDVNLELKNPDGQKYQFIPDPFAETTENPLYNIWKKDNERVRDRLISSFSANYAPASWVNFDAKYAFELANTDYREYDPKDTYERGGSGQQYSDGSLYEYRSRRKDETVQTTANLQKMFGDFTVKAKLSYLYEKRFWEEMYGYGKNFRFNAGIPAFNNIGEAADVTAHNESTEEVTKNYFGIASLDYKGKYIFDGMYRVDGSSLFGEDERWNPYYRVSGAYRITEDFKIPHVNELKLRAAYGTSGQRPGYAYQHEAVKVSTGGGYDKWTRGNSILKPSRSTEWELGMNITFLERFNLEAIYSNTETSDQFIESPLPSHLGGWGSKWINGGTLEAKAIELSLGAQVVKSVVDWNINLTFDKVSTEITKLDVAPFQYGPQGQEADKLFFMREGEEFGTMYGYHFLTSLDEMEKQLGEGESISDYEINSDGYVVPAGSQGTKDEKAIMQKDESGQNKIVKIGSGTPDFNLRIASNLKYKGFTFYMLWDWKKGGEVYNKTAQWLTRDNRWAKMDQTGKAEADKKTVTYYKEFYAINEMADYWVEDASYLKLREASIYYTVPKQKLSGILNGFIKGVKVGVIGRNLLTFTDYSGYDPEVQTWNEDGVQYFPYDFMGYPNYRTFSGSIELKF